MLISLEWIKEFTKLPESNADDIANDFTMTTAEVEEVIKSDQHLEQIKVARIISIRKHPEADKLNLVTVDYGQSKEVVCGASNVREGILIPYAPLGVTLPNGLTLEPKKIRGVLSEGMLCSADELGYGEQSDGLLELKDAKVGSSMSDYFKIKPATILDVDNKSLTHRPDLWGHYGLAREFAARYEVPLDNPFDEKWVSQIEKLFNDKKAPLKVKIQESSCHAYWGVSMDGVKVRPSSEQMQKRLTQVGLRPINNIVDISNYAMIELGTPLHIFDRKKIAGDTIFIKRAEQGQSFTTLDDVERTLEASDTIISDKDQALVLAGVMGGLNSGVEDTTSSIFIEVANFQADEVRKTSTRLGLRTDSSTRYEKSLDPKQTYRTLLRVIDLIKKECPDAIIIGHPQYDGVELKAIKDLVIKTSVDKICKTLGHTLEASKIISIFERLGFKVEGRASLTVSIPSYRTTKDIEVEADLVEEIGRMIGYDNITPVSPQDEISATRLSPRKVLQRKIQDFLCLNRESLEVMTYPLIGKKLLNKAKWANFNEELELVNSISEDADRMRPSLIPHALQTIALNSKNFSDFSFFEIGRSYLGYENERHQLVFGSFSRSNNQFINLLNTSKKLLNYLKIPFQTEEKNTKIQNPLVPSEWEGLHPFEYVNFRVMGKFAATAFSIHPVLLKDFKVKGEASVFVLDITDFQDREIKSKDSYSPISKFPSATFDCTVLASKETAAAQVLVALKKVKIKQMSDSKIVDVFEMQEQRAITIRVVFEDANQTLSAEFIKQSEDKVISTLDSAGFPLKS